MSNITLINPTPQDESQQHRQDMTTAPAQRARNCKKLVQATETMEPRTVTSTACLTNW